jgi:hypothetical protein
MYARPSAVLVEPRSTAPLSPSLPVRAFSAANRACDEASDVLPAIPDGSDSTICQESPPSLRSSRIPVTRARAIHLRHRLIKKRRLRGTRTPSIDENPSHEETTGLAARVLVAFATASRFQRSFTVTAEPPFIFVKGEPAS